MADLIYEYGSDAAGLHFTIEAVSTATGTSFTVHVLTGSLDMNAIYWGDGDALAKESTYDDFTGAKSESSLNMNGTNVVWGTNDPTVLDVFDGGVKLSDAGLGSLGTAKDTYLTAGETQTFSTDVDIFAKTSTFDGAVVLGVRATSTSTADGSIKWVDEHGDPPQPPSGPPPEVCFDGLSQGAWATPDSGAGDWSKVSDYQQGNSYDTVFGIVAGSNLNTATLLQVLQPPNETPPNESSLAKQAVGALLNADSTGEATLTEAYRFSDSDIIAAVQKVYGGAGGSTFDATHAGQLQNLLEFWNIAPESNTADGAHHPGELCSDDTTALATTLTLDKDGNPLTTDDILLGGSFDGDIFTVLHNLYDGGGHYWL